MEQRPSNIDSHQINRFIASEGDKHANDTKATNRITKLIFSESLL